MMNLEQVTAATIASGTMENEAAVRLLYEMVRIRRFEEKCAELYSLAKIRGFLHLYIGEEAVAAGAMAALQPEDRIVSTYREHGHALARGVPMGSVMAEMFGRVNGCSRGRGGSMHLFDSAHNFYGGYAIVGGGIPIAVGLALADRMLHRPVVTACFFGDGAVAEGEFHESMNLAALWKLPVLFICENNLYAMGTALERHQAETDIAMKAAGYRVAAATVDGMDVRAVEREMRKAVDRVRTASEPFLLECRTYRFRAHSMYDPDLYRTKDEIESWKNSCPIAAYRDLLIGEAILTDQGLAKIEGDVAAEIETAIAFADAGEYETVEDSMNDVTARS